MKEIRNIAIGVILGLLTAGIVFLSVSPPRGEPIQLTPRPSEAPIVISIQGEVMQPGVYSLPIGSRLQDAIEQAGGVTTNANQISLKLATLLKDGDAIIIPSKGMAESDIPETQSGIIERSNSSVFTEACININTATAEELETLPGIGPTRSAAIIDYRETNGPFYKLEDLMQVPGIGPSTFDALKEQIETDVYSDCK